MQAVTDPDTQTGWYDSADNEIGDKLAWTFAGTVTFHGNTYILQEDVEQRQLDLCDRLHAWGADGCERVSGQRVGDGELDGPGVERWQCDSVVHCDVEPGWADGDG
jgi:hypothetical protein